ncbi:hypothetical protein FFLO_00475 [Filobasidium floriforme]|uniref:thioredoxin-dependent peroxiredoxin n=1 Tax=Filobasidium floriforme TaxID=5210 RepID=A0A8K0JRH9_9TREE|nr:thioredoxin-like protein [Filobasidium floriforme]KAG7575311.1 hypothetical protein FFLO_00475 [Filobasidium floriforme]KAH8078896.1 thioredoxin-like protein [Filobasidium floriforme]
MPFSHPMLGKRAPFIALPDANGNLYELPVGQKAIALYVFPRAGSPVCTKEACAFNEARDLNPVFSYLNKYDFEIIGISGDPISRQHKFVQNHNLNHVVLSDTSGEARRAYGVTKVLGFIPGRETFFIGRDGIIKGVCTKQLNHKAHLALIESCLRVETEVMENM